MSLKQYFQRYLLLLTGVVIFLSYVNRAVFTHSHILPDGRIVIHAHPYLKHQEKDAAKGNPVHSHHHTPGQYCLLSHHIVYFSSAGSGFQAPLPRTGTHYHTAGIGSWKTVSVKVYRIRPPPATI